MKSCLATRAAAIRVPAGRALRGRVSDSGGTMGSAYNFPKIGYSEPAPWRLRRRDPLTVVADATAMIVIGIILGAFGIGFFCWLLFALAAYALPVFAGVMAGLAAFHSGAGVIGAIVVAILAGVTTLAAGQLAFAATRSPLVRAAIALLFAVPAAVAGYHATLALAQIGVPSQAWREALNLYREIGATGHAERLGREIAA